MPPVRRRKDCLPTTTSWTSVKCLPCHRNGCWQTTNRSSLVLRGLSLVGSIGRTRRTYGLIFIYSVVVMMSRSSLLLVQASSPAPCYGLTASMRSTGSFQETRLAARRSHPLTGRISSRPTSSAKARLGAVQSAMGPGCKTRLQRVILTRSSGTLPTSGGMSTVRLNANSLPIRCQRDRRCLKRR